MAVATLAEIKEQLAITADLGDADDALLGRLLGFDMEAAVTAEREGFEEGVPAELKHAVLMLAGHLYGNREATADIEVREVPFGVREIVESYREWSF